LPQAANTLAPTLVYVFYVGWYVLALYRAWVLIAAATLSGNSLR